MKKLKGLTFLFTADWVEKLEGTSLGPKAKAFRAQGSQFFVLKSKIQAYSSKTCELINSILGPPNRITVHWQGGGARVGSYNHPPQEALWTKLFPPSVTVELIKIA